MSVETWSRKEADFNLKLLRELMLELRFPVPAVDWEDVPAVVDRARDRDFLFSGMEDN